MKQSTLILFFCIVSSLVFKAQDFSLVFPKDSMTITNDSICFSWNTSESSQSFIFQSSLEPDFMSLLQSVSLNSNQYKTSIETNSHMFWRIINQNSGLQNDTSEIRLLKHVSIADLPDLYFWFIGDSSVGVNGNQVLSWGDQGPNSFSIEQSQNNRQPNLLDSLALLNCHSAVEFDGIDDFIFSNSFDLPQPLNYFLFFRNRDLNSIIMDGSTSVARHPVRLINNNYGFYSGQQYISSTTTIDTINYKILNFETVDSETKVYFNGNLENQGMSGSNSSGGLTLGALSSGGFYSKVIFPEVIAFSNEMDDSIRLSITNYLFDKYAPLANLGSDIYSNSFCEILISPGKHFIDYQWSDGNTDMERIVSEPGLYSVSVTDIFGRTSQDSIYVELLEVNTVEFGNICLGENLDWDTNLNNNDFVFNWSDNSSDSILTIAGQGEYWVQIIDQSGCIFESDTIEILIDDFEETSSLGPDVNLCSGNSLELISGQNEAISYEWNDSSTNPELVVNTSGTYWVEVENENGCIARDTIDVTIIGQAPTASFVANNFCFGEEVNFTDLSFPPSGESISNWTWNFGDGDDSNDQNPVHSFDDLGIYPVSLTIQTPAGCTDIFETEIQINPLPVADFVVSNLCSDQDAFFDDNSTISSGTINNWSWDFGDSGSANGENVGHTFYDAGNYDVTLTATSDVGCSDTQTLNISINPSPVSNFIASSTCLGQATVFSQNIDTTIAGPAQIYAWDFDNGFTSNFPTTSQTYFVPGSYDVSLSVTSIFGCVDDTIQTVNINDIPNAGFSNLNACIGESTFFTDTTQIFLNDSIAEWNWNFSNQGASDITNPTFTFNNTGNFNVSLEVVSQAGCEASSQNIITVFEDPNPDFEFEPSIGLPPLEVTFENLTSDAINFIWDFGNGDSSLDFSPEYTYLDTGIFTIQLLAINENECSDTLTKTILVIEPIFELDLSDIFCEITNDKIYASALVSNFGNHNINTFDISLNVGNGARITEVWNGLLRPGESFLYDFVAAPEFSPEVNQEFFCSTVSNPNGNNRELTLENNTVCKAISDDEFILFPPYPNPNKGELNFNYILPIDNLVTLEIIDDLGRIVKYRELEGTLGHNSYQMFIPTLEVGSYLIRLSSTSSSQSQWFFVE